MPRLLSPLMPNLAIFATSLAAFVGQAVFGIETGACLSTRRLIFIIICIFQATAVDDVDVDVDVSKQSQRASDFDHSIKIFL